jgi:hypothetical protein
MNAGHNQNRTELRPLQSFSLPDAVDSPPGPLFTIISDQSGNLYCSDEINHRVIALSREGSIRWQRMAKGKAQGEFFYPRGLSLGAIRLNGKTSRCLAIADSWNRRIQFLDLNGNPLTTWAGAGEMPFAEVADVRFIAEGSGQMHTDSLEGSWYVLDRGNHRLCTLSMDGSCLAQVGRCFPPHMEKRWAAPEAFFADDPPNSATAGPREPYDFMYYPERILGNTRQSLFVSESGSRRLKQVIPPHILPISVDSCSSWEWVAANPSSLLAWDLPGRRLRRHCGVAGVCDQVEIAGRPIPSDFAPDEFWVQSGRSIERWQWAPPAHPPNRGHSREYHWISLSAAEEIGRLDLPALQVSIKAALAHADEEIKLADTILAMSEQDLTPRFVDGMSGHANEFTVKCSWATQDIHGALHSWCLGQLERQIARAAGEQAEGKTADLEPTRNALKIQIIAGIAGIQGRIDSLIARLPEPLPGNISDPPPDSWAKVAWIAKSNLEHAKSWIAGWSGLGMCGSDDCA